MEARRIDDVTKALLRYRCVLRRGDDQKIAHVLDRLEKIPMTIQLLGETLIGRSVNRKRHHPQYGPQVKRLIKEWKKVLAEARRIAAESETPTTEASAGDRIVSQQKHCVETVGTNVSNDNETRPDTRYTPSTQSVASINSGNAKSSAAPYFLRSHCFVDCFYTLKNRPYFSL